MSRKSNDTNSQKYFTKDFLEYFEKILVYILGCAKMILFIPTSHQGIMNILRKKYIGKYALSSDTCPKFAILKLRIHHSNAKTVLKR